MKYVTLTTLLIGYLTLDIPFQNLPSNLQELALSSMPQLKSVSWVGPTTISRQIWSFQWLQRLTVRSCENLKCLFSMETHRSLPELMHLHIDDCQELEQIVAADEALVQLPNAELYFPKLKLIEVTNCNKLKSLFPFAMVTMLPRLGTLFISKATQIQEVFRHSRGKDIRNEMEIVFPCLTEITLEDLPNFVDICHGSKLHAVKLLELDITSCPETDPSLRKIQVTLLP